MGNTELLARTLFDIHSKQLNPFYGENKIDSWNDLPDLTDNRTDTDKNFFRLIAKDFINQFSNDKNFHKKLPQLLYEIHAYSLPPHYMTEEDYQIYHNDPEDGCYKNNWTTLANESQDKEQIDKKFFNEIAKCILDELNK